MDLRDIQVYVNKQVEVQGWQGHSNTHRLSYLESEISEVREAMLNFTGTEEQKSEIGSELFDVIWNACEIANRYGIDLNTSAIEKMKHNENREFSKVPNKQERNENEKLDMILGEIRNIRDYSNNEQLKTRKQQNNKM